MVDLTADKVNEHSVKSNANVSVVIALDYTVLLLSKQR
jgi:hypothetical protein